MSMYIVTGCYSVDAIKGMVQKPSDREAATRPLVEAAGGKMISFLLTTGETDFSMVVETDDVEGLMAALIAAASSGMVSNLKTVQAFTSSQFLSAQKRAGQIVSSYKPATA